MGIITEHMVWRYFVNLPKPIDQYPRTFTVPSVVPVIMSIIGPYLVMVPFIKVKILP